MQSRCHQGTDATLGDGPVLLTQQGVVASVAVASVLAAVLEEPH